jgi:WD40 repeat protein
MTNPDPIRSGATRRILFALVCALSCLGRVSAEEPLPPRALARIGSYQFNHGPDVSAVLSPDGSRAVSVAHDHLVFLRGAVDQQVEADARVVVLWDSATGERLREWRVPHAPASQPHFSPDGKTLAVSYGREDKKAGIVIYDVATGKLQTHLSERSHGVSLLGFTADGKSLLCRDGLWDIQTAKPVREWKQLERPSEWIKGREYVWRTVPSADVRFLASLVDDPPDYSKLNVPLGTIIPPHVPQPTVLVMTDATTNKPLYRKVFPRDSLDTFVFSADGQRFFTGGQKITAHETATGKELFALDAKGVYSFTLSPDGRWLLARTGASQIRLWELETKGPSHELFSGLDYINPGAGFSADGKWVAIGHRSTVRVFNTATGKERVPLGHRSAVALRFSSDGKTLFTTCAELRRSWDVSALKKPELRTSTPRNTWEGICGNQVAAHSPDGRLFVDESQTRRLRIRDTATGRVLHELEPDGGSGTFGAFAPDGARVALRRELVKRVDRGGMITQHREEVLQLYDTRTGKKTGDIILNNRISWVVPVFSADGKTLGWVDQFNDVHLHDAVTGKLIRTFHSEQKLPKDECSAAELLFAPDGRHLIVTTYDHDIFTPPDGKKWATLPTRVFRVADGREVSGFYTNPQKTNTALKHSCAACSPDGRLLAVVEAGVGTVRLIDTAEGKVRGELVGHRHGTRGLAFSPDGKTLASGGSDGVAYLWDVADLAVPKEPDKKD